MHTVSFVFWHAVAESPSVSGLYVMQDSSLLSAIDIPPASPRAGSWTKGDPSAHSKTPSQLVSSVQRRG